MNIIINLLPLKTGGGVQVALDFLNQLMLSERGNKHQWVLLCRKNSIFEKDNYANIHETITIKDSVIHRLFFEKITSYSLLKKYKPDVLYTLFGPQFDTNKNVKTISGCAYSNLFFPEISFWKDYPLWSRIIKQFIDKYRLAKILKSDIKIFETKEIRDRAISIYSINPDSAKYVLPSVSSVLSKNNIDNEFDAKCKKMPEGFKIGIIAGYHKNKNLEFLVKVSKILNQKYKKYNIKFVTTLNPELTSTKNYLRKFDSEGLGEYVINVGSIPHKSVRTLYKYLDATILPSRLESFSNMMSESWAFNKPMLISDQSWCRSICGNAAVYYEYNNEEDTAKNIIKLFRSDEYYNQIIMNGISQLKKYPSSIERFDKILNIIESIQ